MGGGGPDYSRVPLRDPEPEELTNLRLGLYDKVLPGLESFNAEDWNNARTIANNALNQQSSLINQLPDTLSKGNSLLDEIAGIARTGNIPSTVADSLNASVNQGLKSSMGSMLNNLAKRGVLNSSVTTQGTNQLAQAAADAFNKNYLTAYNSVISGLGSAAQGAQNNTGALLSAIGSLGNVPNAAYTGVGAQLTPAFNLWKGWQNSYDNRIDYENVVQQGK